MAQAEQPLPAAPGHTEAGQQALAAVSETLARRGYLTTEWWTTIIGGAVSAVLALVHITGSSATHVVAVVSPALLAGLYAVSRTMHKSALASALSDLFPQAGQGNAAVQAQAAQPVAQPATAAAPATPVVQTDPDFAFEGIPPIEEGRG